MAKEHAHENLQDMEVEMRNMETRLDVLMKNKEMLAHRLAEIQGTISGIEEASKAGGEMLFHVGGEAFVKAKPEKDGKVIVMIGADVALEKTAEDAKAFLEKRKNEVEDVAGKAQKEIELLTKRLESMAMSMPGPSQ